MPYADPKKEKAKHAAWYLKNKERIIARRRERGTVRNRRRLEIEKEAALKAHHDFMRSWLIKPWRVSA